MFCGERKENLSKFCPRSAITLSAFVHVAAYTNSPQQHETYQNTNYKILLLYKNKKKINLKENTLVKRRTRQCINRRAAVNSSSSAAIQYNLLICFSYAATLDVDELGPAPLCQKNVEAQTDRKDGWSVSSLVWKNLLRKRTQNATLVKIQADPLWRPTRRILPLTIW